jgi:hypothetical protein
MPWMGAQQEQVDAVAENQSLLHTHSPLLFSQFKVVRHARKAGGAARLSVYCSGTYQPPMQTHSALPCSHSGWRVMSTNALHHFEWRRQLVLYCCVGCHAWLETGFLWG